MTIHVKAVPVNSLAKFVVAELSPEQLAQVREQMGEGVRYFSGHLLANEVVPLDLVNQFTKAAAKAKREPVKAFGMRAGKYGAEQGLKSVFRFILAIASIDYVLKKAPLMWTRVYDGGEMLVEVESRHARIRVVDFPADEAGCARITGWFETIGIHAGAKELECVHSACATANAPECLWDFKWK